MGCLAAGEMPICELCSDDQRYSARPVSIVKISSAHNLRKHKALYKNVTSQN